MQRSKNPLVEELGYGPEDRLVIFHADDVGMSHGSNQAYLALMEAGIVKTGSVMVPCPWAGEILKIAQEKPELELGVHLTLTCEYDHYRWGPVSTAGQRSGLVDSDGRFWRDVQTLGQHADVDAADAEVRAQVDYVKNCGINFTHIDTHMGASLIPQLSASYVTLGMENQVPLLISRQHLINEGRTDDLAQFDAIGMPLVDDFRITPIYTSDPPAEPSATVYERVLSDLPPGRIVYFSLHPNAPGDIEQISPRSAAWRIFEYEYFQSNQLRDFLEAHQIISIGYREICAKMRENLVTKANQ